MRFNLQMVLRLAAWLMAGIAAPLAWGSENAKEILWELSLGHHVDCTPAIGMDGTIYATASGAINDADFSGGKLVAVTPQGDKKWAFETKTDTVSSPAIGEDGTIYFGCRDKMLYAISPDGQEKWHFATGAWLDASPAIGADGTVYAGSWDHKFYAVGTNGTARWSFATGGPVDSSAAIGADGVIYFGSHDKNFYALNPDGSMKWKFATAGVIISSPAITPEGTIYFTSVDGKLYALNPDGSKKWTLWTGGVHRSSPVIDKDGVIYLAVNNTFKAYSPDGREKWGFGYPDVEGCATVAADGQVYFAGQNAGAGNLFGFDFTGQSKNYTTLNGDAQNSATIAPDGTIYVGAIRLLAMKTAVGLQKSGWPKFHGGLRQTGRVGAE